MCDGICCPAYESKLERNQYECLNDTIIPKLCERLDLSYEDVKISCNEEELVNAIHEFFMNDINQLEKRVGKFSDNASFVITNIISCFYFFLKNDIDKLTNYIRKLDVVKASMNIIEMSALLVVIIKASIDKQEFKKALDYYHYALMLDSDNSDIKIMLSECKFIIDCNLYNKYINNNHDVIDKDYEELKANYLLTSPIINQIHLQLQYLKTLDSDKTLEVLANLEHDQIFKNIDEYKYVKALAFVRAKRYKDLIAYLDDCVNLGFKFVSLYAFSVKEIIKKIHDVNDPIRINLKKKLKSLINNAKMDGKDAVHIAFLKLMELEIDDDTDVKIYEYIKCEMGALLKKFNVSFYLEYCLERSCELIGKMTKYKEAYELLNKLLFSSD